jgi:hypothetical protein
LKGLRDKILQLIKNNHGISANQLNDLLDEQEMSHLQVQIERLIACGRITFIWNRYYPNIRSIGLIRKGEAETTEIIDLPNELSIDDLKSVIKPNKDDTAFYDGYLIDEKSKDLFERTNNIHFDFEKYDYYLLSNFDNSNEVNRS